VKFHNCKIIARKIDDDDDDHDQEQIQRKYYALKLTNFLGHFPFSKKHTTFRTLALLSSSGEKPNQLSPLDKANINNSNNNNNNNNNNVQFFTPLEDEAIREQSDRP
jgi:hypothetical protein